MKRCKYCNKIIKEGKYYNMRKYCNMSCKNSDWKRRNVSKKGLMERMGDNDFKEYIKIRYENIKEVI